MPAAGIALHAAGLPPVFRQDVSSSFGRLSSVRLHVPTRRFAAMAAVTTTTTSSNVSENGRFNKEDDEDEAVLKPVMESEEERASLKLKDYFEQSKDLIRSDGGPPRWFSPLECGTRLENSPLLLFLPGVDGVGLGLITQHQRLGEIFDIWCLHIPVMNRTSFKELVKLVERTIQSEICRSPNRPIYIVGESLGGCLALAVAARNPDIDLVLVLANPATSFSKSSLQPLIPLLEVMPDQVYLSLPYTLSLTAGNPLRMAMASFEKGLSLQQTIEELSQGLVSLSSYFSVLADILPRETLLWKLQMLETASAYANSRLHAVKAQTLILSSVKDRFLPSQEEGERLRRALQKCELRKFNDSDHFIFLEDGVDLVTIIKGCSYYRRGRYHDYVSDYMPPTSLEFKNIYEPNSTYAGIRRMLLESELTRPGCGLIAIICYRFNRLDHTREKEARAKGWMETAFSPVLLSTLEDGKIVRNLDGIPSEGPVLLIGYHMLLGLELVPMVTKFMIERNINVRGIAHPMMFKKLRDGRLPELSSYDTLRVMGAVPVSATNFYKLLSSKSHVLLYPGGMREALHRKGEEYKLFWPEQSEFVRMAARFGAKIIPFGAVGEDDIADVVFDYDDLMKIPYFKSQIQELTEEAVKLRADATGEVANQDVHMPGILPKLPGRFYYLFGKPIETEGRKHELRDREKCHDLYLQVKSEVESSIAYLKENREKDPYRNIVNRLLYQARQGFTSEEVPTFDL